ncbi:hypothetical protein OJF2_30570 [Aquisphaera giovannonii]|uniref:Lipoprotein n=1 Tax=Aquisphaera giovannonii TaxID=406548 RepID=A0A5B9W2Q9_9BACT|nr:hypothetical protein [Aquisphaera giovannonii]QEH34517.1 hypothetical protein OJF2_30570 [Aquisphaera giovannonii]
MSALRPSRAPVIAAFLGLFFSVVGCSSEGPINSSPPDKETAKKIAAETKASMKEAMKARGRAGR